MRRLLKIEAMQKNVKIS